jgi:hypothetical protein
VAGSSRAQLISDNWYPAPEQYWVPANEEEMYPFRYGDLFFAPSTGTSGRPLVRASDGKPWHAVLALSPSCEMGAKAKPSSAIEIARVIPLEAQPQDSQASIITGWQERDGRVAIAYAHTVFLAGVPWSTDHQDAMFANLRETVRVSMEHLSSAGRIAAMTHDCRVAIIRRELYYRYRWLVSRDDVQTNETNRISNDPDFIGPRPPWGQLLAMPSHGP